MSGLGATTASNYTATNVFSLKTGRPLASEWTYLVDARLEELIRLPHGWDGYRAEPVAFSTAVFARQMLESICPIDAPAPEVVPGPVGDLQIEWHMPSGEIELHVVAPNEVHGWRQWLDGDWHAEEAVFSNNFALVAKWVMQLMEPPIGAGTAAA